jgi:hypothetical protein
VSGVVLGPAPAPAWPCWFGAVHGGARSGGAEGLFATGTACGAREPTRPCRPAVARCPPNQPSSFWAPWGVLRVNAPPCWPNPGWGRIAAFLAANPAVRVELRLNDRLVDLVDEGVDVALRVSARLGGYPSAANQPRTAS